ncbi:uncharacterized protein LOC109815705 [Cajanus cajan]|uniref:uncharacterized protein LOC109815705 n=1 Tax=Cajanus cajan TaxID=3821 RepID=UPI00098DCD49|nr:uncharacterized protein LOC109815705 [Cajanus cajan]
MLVARGVTVDWECFRTVFMEKYFPESVRHAKEAEFMQLHQGGLSVSEKFAEGLKYELKKVVVLMAITEFLALVEKAKIVERLEGGNRVIKATEGPAGSKRGGGSQRKPYDRPQSQQGGPVIRQPAETTRGGGQGGSVALRCYRCGGSHLIRDCPHTESICFRCQQMGHVSFNCPTRNRLERSTQRSDMQRVDTQRSSVQRTETQRGDRPTTAGRVFTLAVSTPASASVVAYELCANCPIIVNGKKYKEEDELLVSAGQAESMLRDGAECCLLLAMMSVEAERVISEIDVVRDFAEVFPDEVYGLPPAVGFELGVDEILRFKGRICLPRDAELKRAVLEEGHKSRLSIHPGMTKMYQDPKKTFWWSGGIFEMFDGNVISGMDCMWNFLVVLQVLLRFSKIGRSAAEFALSAVLGAGRVAT